MIDDQPSVLADIDELLQRKRTAPEMGLAAPVASIDAFEAGLERLDSFQPPPARRGEVLSQRNEVFHRILMQD